MPAGASKVAMLAVAVLAANADAAGAQELSVEGVLDKNLHAERVANATANASFVLSEPDGGVRVMTAITRTKLAANRSDNMRIVWFQAPAEVSGTATLLVEHADGTDTILVYDPSGKRIRQLMPADEKNSYVGTDFSYADLVGLGVRGWNHQLARRQQLNGHDDYVVVSVPATPDIQNQTGYAKRMTWIRADNFVTEKVQLYGVGDKLLKIITADEIRPVDPAKTSWQPMRLEARNMLSGRTTVVKLTNYTINVGLTAEQFSAQALEYGP